MGLDLLTTLVELLAADPGSGFDDGTGRPMFDPPFFAIALADDVWFARFQEIIGPFHWTPQEALSLIAPAATARSVICWCLPISAHARLANRRETRFPARSWAYVRTFGEEVNNRLRQGMEQHLRSLGFAAIAPAIAPENTVTVRPHVGISSCWSERHTAFVAGLGTFGLSGGLITRHGIAHRLGSIVTDAELPPTARPYGDDPFAWCLRTARGTCGACIRRCPVESIGESVPARDKDACRRHYTGFVKDHGAEPLWMEGGLRLWPLPDGRTLRGS